MPVPRLSRFVLMVAAAAALGACRAGERVQSAPAARPQAEAAVDAGALVLAAVKNARAAIAAGDQLAAFNDVNLGLGYAVRLPGADSALYPPEAAPPGYRDPTAGQGGGGRGLGGGSGRHRHGGGHGGAPASPAPAAPPQQRSALVGGAAAPGPEARHGRHTGARGPAGQAEQSAGASVSSFDAQVRLVSAQAKLQARDVAGADADLQALETAADARGAPASLPLIRADQNLTLASDAVSGGRLAELRTQLSAAQAALEAYQGGPHAAEAKALAAEIRDAMGRPGGAAALQPAQIALWSGVVGAWT